MKLALLTPNYPPRFCGVGDHSFHLKKHLSELGHSVSVFTEETSFETGLQPLASFWSKSPAEFDMVLLQYTPYLYSDRWGRSTLADRLAPWKSKILFLAHELHYPWQLSFAGTVLSFQHRRLFRNLQRLAKQTIFCYEKPISDPSKESWLPVGSNIDPVSPSEKQKSLLVHFGGAHPTHEYELLNEVGMILKETTPTFEKIPCIGVTRADLNKYGNLSHLEPMGKLSSSEVSNILQGSQIVLCPFLDGVSTRRGSFMAALAHGKAVLTNLGTSSNPSIPWHRFSKICEKDPKHYAASIQELLSNSEERERLESLALQFYRKNFDWKIIARKLSDQWLKP